jgi:predicted enzyme related to lactoylglutathione lyase
MFMSRVIHFEISADNPDRAVDFYSEAFGWEIQKWAGPMDYWLVMTGKNPEPGIDGAIMKRTPQGQPIVNTVTSYLPMRRWRKSRRRAAR